MPFQCQMNPDNPPLTIMEIQDKVIKKAALDHLNQLFSETAKYFNFQYKLLIYRLLKRGRVGVKALSQDAQLSVPRLYGIVDELDKLLASDEAKMGKEVNS